MHPTFCNGGELFRPGDPLKPYRDVLFRENGACIHSFEQVNPGALDAGTAGRSVALRRAEVWPVDGIASPRAPSAAVPSPVKWLNDKLDELASLSQRCQNPELDAATDSLHLTLVSECRALDGVSASRVIRLSAQNSKTDNPDAWEGPEREGLETLLDALSILGLAYELSVTDATNGHAKMSVAGQAMDVVTVRGDSHAECAKHLRMSFVPLPRRRALLVSRDPENNEHRREYDSFLKVRENSAADEPRITEPDSGLLHVGYRQLYVAYRDSHSRDTLRDRLDGEFAA